MVKKVYLCITLLVLVLEGFIVLSTFYNKENVGKNNFDSFLENSSTEKDFTEGEFYDGKEATDVKEEEAVSEPKEQEVMSETMEEAAPESIVEDANQTVSLFSWHFELTNQVQFFKLIRPVQELGINRMYQIISVRNIKEPDMRIMIQRLSERGIETVALTGSPSWIEDGLGEYKKVLKGINEYNENVSEQYQIRKIALDVEVYRLDDWDDKEEELFEQYVDMMKEAKELAESYKLETIQIIPAWYDEVDEELFQVFLEKCCDEISIMNYDRKRAHEAIAYEVEMCREFDIPVETIFETMPLSSEYEVTEGITYFYDGIEAVRENFKKMQNVYGVELGIAYHHFSSIYEMLSNEHLGEIYIPSLVEEEKHVGNLLLYGSDGSCLLATPYWPGGRKNKGEICWLVSGVKKELSYDLVYYDLFQEISIAESVSFDKTEGIELKLTITE